MIPKIKSNYILIVEGVYLDDIVKHANRTLNNNNDSYIDISMNAPPNFFVSVEEWPKTTRLLCWECCEKCDSYPCFIPSCPTAWKGEGVKYKTMGVFCSWNCAMKHAHISFGETKMWEIEKHIYDIAMMFDLSEGNNMKIKKIILPSPDKTIMKKYCGNGGLSIEEYKEKIRQINNMVDRTTFS